MSTIGDMCVVNAGVCVFSPAVTLEPIKEFLQQLTSSHMRLMAHLQSSRHDAENLLSPPSTQLYHFSLGRFPRWRLARQCDMTPGQTSFAAGCMGNYQPAGIRGCSSLHCYHVTERWKLCLRLGMCQYILIPVWTGIIMQYNVGGAPMYGESKHRTTSCEQSSYSEAKKGFIRFLPIRTSSPLITVDPPHPTLTHWGRVTQICVFTLQQCKTDDANLRF